MNSMKKFSLIMSVALLLAASAPAEEHIRPASSSKRVVNGENADAHEWPWQISLASDTQSHFCGGSIIAPDWVLTAAHCVTSRTAKSLIILVGAHERQKLTQHLKVHYAKEIYIHKSYHRRHLRADVALIHLQDSIALHKHVAAIPLPRQGDRVSPGTKCFVTGWGRTNAHSTTANVLQEADMTIGRSTDCTHSFKSFYDDNTMLCAGSQGKGGCYGDSGGPLACWENGQWFLRGVTSFVITGCLVDRHTGFARVSTFVDWIQEKMKN
ncbi:chymotrypsinogen A [Exaiptasia diaphana]|uniref:Peptidase S1 domain-containing protein n=1 Tax=Exaiptasia diaphana TaxID=2652724 RepID=A0A913Y6A6_EXADI|nr:chymotrypsinogen A [Exaiptasia diaphana]KXJ21946.1 Chymotrypsin-like elastase family member 3B [Exaiptasia diaphana]